MAEVDDSPRSDDSDSLEPLTKLRNEYKDLSSDAQQLLTEKLYLENECARLKKRVNSLDEEVRSLRKPPFVVGHVQDRVEDKAVVRSSNGTVFLVTINTRIDEEKIKPGARVALNQDSLSIIEVLNDSWDPIVTSAEIIERPNSSFDDLGGLDEQIKELRESIELPLNRPDAFLDFGITPPKGVLITGPPGTGKTAMAKAIANSTEVTFLGLVGSELAQKYIGEGGRIVRELFDLARDRAPAIIFIDEIDSIGSKRLDVATSGDREVQRTLMQLLAELDGFDALDDVKIIAATNRPELLDPALLRPGRFDRLINIDLPNLEARESIFEVYCRNLPKKNKIDTRKLAISSDGFSGAEIKSVVTEAAISAIADGRDSCHEDDFTNAMSKLREKRESGVDSPDGLYG
ncbi:MAG: proteasome-activating nucleotidase [Euryarchaeota archaeon]|nr:proteasome-activating nucleotidase [Euryarchaeota archaeon]